MNILIGTPAYDEKVTVSYVSSLIGVKELFERHVPRIESTFFLFSHALVAYSRNVFASRLLEHPEYTHLLMVDSDMGFSPDLIMRMLEMDKPICTATYPKRTLDLDRLMTLARTMPDDTPLSRARALGMAYEFVAEGNINLTGDGPHRTLDIDRGFVRCQASGAGVMLIRRDVVEQMREHYPELVSPSAPGGPTTVMKEFFQPFNEYVLDNGVTLSEDLSFCHRWSTGLSGEIWTNIDYEFIHQGTMKHKARFMDKIMSVAVSSDIDGS